MNEWQSGFQTKRYVTDPKELFGYNEPGEVLEQLCLTLGGGTSTQILGERNAGKTSVLRCVATRFLATRPRHLPVYLEFRGTGVGDPLDAYRHIVAQIHATFLARSSAPEELDFGRLRLSTEPNPDVHFAALQALNEYEVFSAVEGYFQRINERGFGVLLLFDEYEYLMRTVLHGEAEKFWQMRRVGQIPAQRGSPCPLTIALAGALEWCDFCGRDGSPPLNIVSALRILPPLSREAFGKMWAHCRGQSGREVRRRLDRFGANIDHIYDLAGGWAFAGKMIGQHLVTCNRLDEEQLASDFRPHFQVLWDQRKDAERERLLAVARGDAVPLDALTDLRQRGLAEDDGNGKARLRGELWRNWVVAHLASSPVPARIEVAALNLFRREDKCYRVRYQGGEVRSFQATNGFHYLAQLLSRPNRPRPIEASRLERSASEGCPPRSSTEDDEAPTNDSYAPQQAADRETCEQVAKELQTVTARIADIEELGFDENKGELESLREKQKGLSDYLKKSSGLGGRGRTLSSPPQQKAYDRVRHALSKAYEIIEDTLPELASHLRDSIKAESNSFAYRPAPPIDWES